MIKTYFFFTAVIFSLLLLIFPAFVSAQNRQRQSQPVTMVLPQNEVVNRDYFAGGETVILSGTVNGDAYLGGANIIVEGTINGDLLAAGGNITMRGNVTRNVRVVGGNISIQGNVGGNLSAAGGNININNATKLAGSIASAGGNIEILAPVTREANLAGGQVTIGNSIGGDLTAATSQLTLTSQAKVNGNVKYWSETEANIQPGAVITGQISRQEIPAQYANRPNRGEAIKALTTAALFLKVIGLVSRFILGLLFLLLFPVFTKRIAETIEERPWISLLVGFLTMILIPAVFLILLLTIVGVPLAFILLTVFLIICYIAPIFTALWFGWRLFKRSDGLILLAGLIVYELLSFIPILGWLAVALAVMLGIGALFTANRFAYTEFRNKKLI